jgi:hypothetical protein
MKFQQMSDLFLTFFNYTVHLKKQTIVIGSYSGVNQGT